MPIPSPRATVESEKKQRVNIEQYVLRFHQSVWYYKRLTIISWRFFHEGCGSARVQWGCNCEITLHLPTNPTWYNWYLNMHELWPVYITAFEIQHNQLFFTFISNFHREIGEIHTPGVTQDSGRPWSTWLQWVSAAAHVNVIAHWNHRSPRCRFFYINLAFLDLKKYFTISAT